ncbi:hypothetical protein I862_01975 [endosymbiont of Acanthamoeba sp. UWC8]|uniref:LysM peptidoglycan-binding domain-containing protein n=1 Tax=endosymbiont of Acanthamoeba sp. UWC8 TaxID=86106 RepID=UPI0004D0F355|nr:LysM domain-containing protein [endosymbiont of Acanthamoeba sp. UWC8]AIF80958.1 hypothetical protein I862_01975 [endosymbiont of Acanthamoeba sp. UWC8]
MNGIKSSEALDHFIEKMQARIKSAEERNALNSYNMMQSQLVSSFGEVVSVELMDAISSQGYLVNGGIDYNNCQSLKKLNVSPATQAIRDVGLITICDKIGQALKGDYSSDISRFKDNLVRLLTGGLYSVKKEGISNIAQFLASEGVNFVRSRVEMHEKEKAEAEAKAEKEKAERMRPVREQADDMLFRYDETTEYVKNKLDESMKRAEVKIHEVEIGDTVDGIAAEYGVSRDDILEANPKLKDKTSVDKQGRTIILIKVGENLILPQGASKQTGSKGSSGNQNNYKPANDNTDTKSAFNQPEPDRSNNKAEPRSSSQPTYSCIDGMCSMDGEQLWSNKEAGYTAQDSAKATRISDNHDYTTNAGDDNANRAGDLKYEEFKRRELSKWQWELYEHHVNNDVNNNILENPYFIEYNLYNDELLDDYLRGAYAQYQKEGDFTTSPYGLMLHTTGSGINEFKNTEKYKDIKRFIFNPIVIDISISEAVASQLPGRENGPADAYRHLLWSGELTRRYPEWGVEWGLNKHEETSPSIGSASDYYNNKIGMEIARDVAKKGGDWHDIKRLSRDAINKSFRDYDPNSPQGWIKHTNEYGEFYTTCKERITLDNGLEIDRVSVLHPSQWNGNPKIKIDGVEVELSIKESNWPKGNWEKNFIYEPGSKAKKYE